MNNVTYLIKTANKEIEKIIAYVKEHEEAFEHTNLKLYDVASDDSILNKYNVNENQFEDLFNTFCNDSYNSYEDWRKEEGLTNEHNYIGRTSSFYFHDNKLIEHSSYRGRDTGIDFSEVIYNCIYEGISYNSWAYDIIDSNGYLSKDKLTSIMNKQDKHYLSDFIDDVKQDLETVISDLYKYVTEALEDTIKDYEYIKDFKEKQLEYFEEFVQYECMDYETA